MVLQINTTVHPPPSDTIPQPSRTSGLQRVRRRLTGLASSYAQPGTLAREASLLFGYTFMGWNDASAGALLPAIQRHYNTSYAITSLLFVCNLVGWILAAVLTPIALNRLTVGRCIPLVAALAIVPSIMIVPGPPFPVMAFAYIFYGLSIGAQEAITNAWVSARPNANVRLGCLHFLYGLGALCAPLAGTPFVARGVQFSYFYFASLGLSLLNTIGITASFRFNREGYPARPTDAAIDMDRTADDAGQERPVGLPALWRQRDTYIFALFALFYVGTEVAIGGWSSTYIIEVQGNEKDSGHLVSGFWAGLAAGRILLLPLTSFLGSQLAVLVYLAISIGLQLVFWLVPGLISSAFSLAFMGLFVGPIFPIMVQLITLKIRPRSTHTLAIAFIVTFGSAGSALFPLIVGLIAQGKGIQILPPTIFAFLVAQAVIWACLGWPSKADEQRRASID